MKHQKAYESYILNGKIKNITRVKGDQNWLITQQKGVIPFLTSQITAFDKFAITSPDRQRLGYLKDALVEKLVQEIIDNNWQKDTEILSELLTFEECTDLISLLLKYLKDNEKLFRSYLKIIKPMVDDGFIFSLYTDSIEKSRVKYRENIETIYQTCDAPVDRFLKIVTKGKINQKVFKDFYEYIETHDEPEFAEVTVQELIIVATVIQEFSTKTILELIELKGENNE